MEPETFYQIYNRGINGESIFKQKNHAYFLSLFAKYLPDVADLYA